MLIDEVTRGVINAAMTVHTAGGAGLLEKAYDSCFYSELATTGLRFEHQVKLPVLYRGTRIEAGFRTDYVVENCVLVELKAVEFLHPVHTAQVLSYLKRTGLSLGLLINFNVPHLRDGIRRLVNNYKPERVIRIDCVSSTCCARPTQVLPLRPQRPPRLSAWRDRLPLRVLCVLGGDLKTDPRNPPRSSRSL
jgi:GxxExxY protein